MKPDLCSTSVTVSSTKLRKSIAGWYAISEEFAGAVLARYLPGRDLSALSSLQVLLDAFPSHRVQLEYAFSTNVRGRQLRDALLEHGILIGPFASQNCLDVGCAYGGYLNAMRDLGFECCGIEISPALAQLGRLNASGGNLLVGDFLEFDFSSIAPRKGYDLIICNDVIEHVSDPAKCLSKISSLLSATGVAYVETGNRHSMLNVMRDIHFQMYGLALLPHTSATAYYCKMSGSDRYEVGEFYDASWYINSVKRQTGYRACVFPAPVTGESAVELMARLFAEHAQWKQHESHKVSVFLADELESRFAQYSIELCTAYAQSLQTGNWKEFATVWIDPLIRFVIRRQPAGLDGDHKSGVAGAVAG